MAHSDDTLTRRQLLKNLAFTATAASAVTSACTTDAHAGDPAANAKVKAVLDELLKTTPEVGLQVAGYLNNKLVLAAPHPGDNTTVSSSLMFWAVP